MSGQNAPEAQNTLSKKDGNVVDVYHASASVYFKPDTEELVLLADEACDEFDRHWGELHAAVSEVHEAEQAYAAAIAEYSTVFCRPAESAKEAAIEDKATELQETVVRKKTALQEKMGSMGPTGYESMVELIPVVTRKKNGRRSGSGSKYIYVKKGYYDKLGAGKRHNVSLKAKDKASASESIFTYDKQGNRKGIDTRKLKAQLTSITVNRPDTSVQLFRLDAGEIDKTLTGWAESWNKSLNADNKEKEIGQHIDVSAGAQFMRFTANAGASGEWDPWKGEATVSGEASAVLSIAQGCASATFYLPDRVGWPLTYTPEGGATLSMGMLRVYLETQLGGFAGASARIENQLQVTTIDAKQVLMGQRDRESTLPRFSERRASGRAFQQGMKKEDEGVTSSAAIFAGAKVEFGLKGGVQWLQPVAASAYQGQAAAEFVDFCTIAPSIDVMAGAGAGFTFFCTFVNGKFCFKIAASLCCGAGAKGALTCEVGYENLSRFGAWLAYQLYGLDYHFFDLVVKEAFQAYSRICVMLLSDMKEQVIQLLDKVGTTHDKINELFISFQSNVSEGLEASAKRNELANKINSKPQELLKYTPETKGNLIYLLTRHGIWDHVDLDNRGNHIIPDIYHDRKKAIIHILSSIQTQREWIKVMTHCSRDGQDLALTHPLSEEELVAWQESELRTFLREGLNRDKEMDAIKKRIRGGVAWGYALAMNDTWDYQLAQQDNPFYPRMGDFGPLSPNQVLA